MIRSGQPYYDREELLAGLSRGLNAISRASDIVRNLRRFLRKEALNRERLDLNAAVREAVEIGAVGFERRGGGRIIWDLVSGLPPIEGDRTQVQQVVVNLVRNAVEAMAGQTNQTLTISTRRRGDGVRLSIADTGPGLPPMVREAPFQPFVTTKAGGMGLGLSICREIVEAHHGHLTAAPNPKGGTMFRLTLPMPPDRPEEDTEAAGDA